MFDDLKNLWQKITNVDAENLKIDNAEQVIIAALFIHLVKADGVVSESEQTLMKKLLHKEYQLDSGKLDELILEGEKADNEAVDLYRFTNNLKQHLDQHARCRLVKMLWQLVYVDGVLHEVEDNIVWRISELLNVNQRERRLLRQEVLASNEQNP